MHDRTARTEKRVLAERVGNILFAIPAVAQLWARVVSKKTSTGTRAMSRATAGDEQRIQNQTGQV